jgi:hypothetical protein
MPYLGYLATQAHYCLGSLAVTPLGASIYPAQPPRRNPGHHASLREGCRAWRGYLLAAQLTEMTAIIWAVFSSAASPAMSAHRSHDTWQ